jgi:hypothetical protein
MLHQQIYKEKKKEAEFHDMGEECHHHNTPLTQNLKFTLFAACTMTLLPDTGLSKQQVIA